MVTDHPQHRLAVLGEAGEGAQLAGDLGRCRVGDRGHQRADRAADVARGVGVVGATGGHQVAADVGEAEAQGAEFVGQLGDAPRRELGHHHRDLEHQRPQPDPVLERRDVELAIGVLERHQVEGRQVAGGIVEEHVLGAGIRRVDAAAGRTGVPFVDGGVVLEAGVGAAPGGVGDLIPQLAGRYALGDFAVGPGDQLPLAVLQHLLEEGVGHPDAVVGVLPGDGAVGLGIPIGVVLRKRHLGVALAGELDDPLDIALGDHHLAGAEHRLFELGVAPRVEPRLAFAAGDLAARRHHRVQVLAGEPGAGHHRRDLLLLADLPVDEVLDVGMIDVDHHHLGGAAGGAAGLDRPGGAVADLEEAHQPGRTAAAGKRLVLAAEHGEIRAGAGPVLEQARLADPEVHDAALVDQVVLDALDEAGVGLRVFVGGFRLPHLARFVIGVIVALGRAVDAVGPVQAGVEPLRRVRGAHLFGQHVAELVEERPCILLRIEIAALPAPIGPGAGELVEHLPGAGLAAVAPVYRQTFQRLDVGRPAPQPRRHVALLDGLEPRRHTGLAEVFLGEHVTGDLRPAGGHLDVVLAEHHRPIRIADFAGNLAERDRLVG